MYSLVSQSFFFFGDFEAYPVCLHVTSRRGQLLKYSDLSRRNLQFAREQTEITLPDPFDEQRSLIKRLMYDLHGVGTSVPSALGVLSYPQL